MYMVYMDFLAYIYIYMDFLASELLVKKMQKIRNRYIRTSWEVLNANELKFGSKVFIIKLQLCAKLHLSSSNRSPIKNKLINH